MSYSLGTGAGGGGGVRERKGVLEEGGFLDPFLFVLFDSPGKLSINEGRSLTLKTLSSEQSQSQKAKPLCFSLGRRKDQRPPPSDKRQHLNEK